MGMNRCKRQRAFRRVNSSSASPAANLRSAMANVKANEPELLACLRDLPVRFQQADVAKPDELLPDACWTGLSRDDLDDNQVGL